MTSTLWRHIRLSGQHALRKLQLGDAFASLREPALARSSFSRCDECRRFRARDGDRTRRRCRASDSSRARGAGRVGRSVGYCERLASLCGGGALGGLLLWLGMCIACGGGCGALRHGARDRGDSIDKLGAEEQGQSKSSAGADYVKIVSTRSTVSSKKGSQRLANLASRVRRTRCASRITSSTSLGRSSCVIACSATRASSARALRACLIICYNSIHI